MHLDRDRSWEERGREAPEPARSDEREGITPQALLESLGVKDVIGVEKVTGGTDTAIWRVETAGPTYALRVFRTDQMETCCREVAAMQAASAMRIPVPTVHAKGFYGGVPVLLLSWCAGKTILQELRERPWQAWRLGVLFGRMQARIHSVSAPAELGDATSWIDWAGENEPELKKRLAARRLGARQLLHLDYHPLNVMTDGKRVTVVLDWANACAGDPRADVARTLTILRLNAERAEMPAPLARVMTRSLELGWRRGYRQVAGSLGDLDIFYAWAGASMETDLLLPGLDQPGRLTRWQLARIRAWTQHWKQRVDQG